MINPRARLGYLYGINVKEEPYEAPLPTNSEDFFYGKQPRRRLAGDILNLDLTKSPGAPATLPLPKLGGAEMRVPDSAV